MAQARNELISLKETPYYHCVSRCVRRAHLCGDDYQSGQNFDHRKAWLVDKMKELSAKFSIDICAYAVMSNHYHLVLFVDESRAKSWSDEEVIKRWTALFPRNASIVKTLMLNQSSSMARKQLKTTVRQWRERLTDISWYMRCLNESIARRANREDECTGRFWEGRFKSQALLDERALVMCMAYVDLNPIRAGISQSLEESDFTSVQERLVSHAKRLKTTSKGQQQLIRRFDKDRAKSLTDPRKQSSGRTNQAPLARLKRSHSKTDETGLTPTLPLSRDSYIELLRWTAKSVSHTATNPEKNLQTPQLLTDMGIPTIHWLSTVSSFEKKYALAAGSKTSLVKFQSNRYKNHQTLKHPDKWIRGLNA